MRRANRSRAWVAVAVLAFLVVTAVGVAPVRAADPVPYDGPDWMMKLAIVGDSLVTTTEPEIKDAVRADWWRDATSAIPGILIDRMRDQIRVMAADRPQAFVLVLGNLDTLWLKNGDYSWSFVKSQIDGALDDIQAAGVPCVTWIGPHEHKDGGELDYWAGRINDEIRSQLAARGLGVFGDWQAASKDHPEYFLYDGSHFTDVGKAAFTKLMTDRLRDCTRNPGGSLDQVNPGIGSARVVGWANDPDTLDPVGVHVYVDGAFQGAYTADAYRPDVGAAFPWYGNNRGFAMQVPLTGGNHQVCVFAINLGPYGFRNPLLGCRTVSMERSAIGAFDTAAGSDGTIRATGWAIDPDWKQPTDVHVYVDGTFAGSFDADASRPDVGAAFPGYGNNHGFDLALTGQVKGRHDVCVWAINVLGTPGVNNSLGCKSVNVPKGANPIGSYDSLRRPSTAKLRLTGWALDMDTATSPTDVHVYLDGAFSGAFAADTSRPDVGAAFPGTGDDHGFDITLSGVSDGAHDVCAWAINTGIGGGNQLLGCKHVA